MALNKLQPTRGFSLVEVIIVSAIMLVVFGGLLSGFRYSLELITTSRATLTALTVANDQMEYIRSLSYNAAGTVAGLPAGAIPQVSTTSLNQIPFTKTVLIRYVDSPADGLGAADTNGITTDYKEAKITVSWTQRGVPKEIFLVSTIIPRSIETNVGGGTMRVNVFDSTATIPLPGVDVRLLNTSGTSTVDVMVSTDASGVALFGGAPAGAGYQVFVSAPGYSKDQTYVATTSLPNPNTLPATVAVSNVTTLNFFIDRLATLGVTTLASKSEASSTEQFSTSAGIATSTNTEVTGGQITLYSTSGVYANVGSFYLSSTTPAVVSQWLGVLVSGSLPGTTNRRLSFYTITGTSTYALIPDSDLPGNSSGFTGSVIPLDTLNATTYPSLTIGATLTTTNTSVTPTLEEVSLWYVTSQTTRNNLPITLTGNRTIGTRADTSQVYKNIYATTTNSIGSRTLSGVEYDQYTLSSSGFDVSEACSANPIVVLANSTVSSVYTLVADTTNTLRIIVKRPDGTPLPGARVELSASGAPIVRYTGWCGQAFFSSLTSSPDYDLSVSAPGYTTNTQLDFDITGDVERTITF